MDMGLPGDVIAIDAEQIAHETEEVPLTHESMGEKSIMT